MSNPANPISVGVTATEILSEPASRVALELPDDATQNVTVVVTWLGGDTETAVLMAGGAGKVFEGSAKYLVSITGTVAAGTQDVYRSVLKPYLG